jgi:quinohemoprotein amine dehydrogenase beta subunit
MVINRPNNLHIVDLGDNTIYKTCELPGNMSPAVTQVSPDRRTAYVLNNNFEDIYGVDLDTCKLVFHAAMSQAGNERTKSMFAFAIGADGKELYAVQNPTLLDRDRYQVQAPRFAVYDTSAGLDAKPVRTFPAPRQISIMLAAQDGSVYMAGPDLYKVDVKDGSMTTALPIRNWKRPDYGPVDVLDVWPVQTPSGDFTLSYTTAKFKDASQNPDTADYRYGILNVNLRTGETEAPEFGPLTEIYFTTIRSPKDRNIVYGLLHRLAKYDIRTKKLIDAVELPHTYYCLLINRTGDRVYLTGTFNDIAIYDGESLKKLGAIQLPGGDMSLGTGQIFVR